MFVRGCLMFHETKLNPCLHCACERPTLGYSESCNFGMFFINYVCFLSPQPYAAPNLYPFLRTIRSPLPLPSLTLRQMSNYNYCFTRQGTVKESEIKN